MEKKDLKDIERELINIKAFVIGQARLQKDILNEIKGLRRDLKSQHSME